MKGSDAELVPAALSLGLSTASITNGLVHLPAPPIIHQGWVLKKRRKKMQGFARRYFTLYQSGLLSYSFEPSQPTRDQVHLQNAAISTAPGRKDIHIDSNTATFHIKCLSTDDFNAWMTAFRKFISNGEIKRAATLRHAVRQASISVNRSGPLLEELGTVSAMNGLSALDAAIHHLHQEMTSQKASVSTKKAEKHPGKEFKSLFRKSHHSLQDSGDTNNSVTDSLQDIQSKLDVLKSQYQALVKAIQAPPHDTSPAVSSLPYTPEEDSHPGLSQPLKSASTRHSIRNSVASTTSGSMEWYDAEDDGPQEFIMDLGPEPTEPGSRLISQEEETGHDNSSIDTDIEDPETDATPLAEQPPILSGHAQVIRRSQLPCLPPSDEGSLFAMLKKNDLSTITFPVTFNEPLTMLQRAAEEVEYYNLLDDAAGTTDRATRMAYVAAFAISSYAHTRHRSGRKGFNPLLAETFEDTRMRFVAEKVRHNPLEIAYHAEGDDWELTATTAGKTKFWGKSLEIIPLGTNRLRIGKDVYSWCKPSSFMRNLMVGTKYFEHCGQMTIENSTTSERCIVDFKQNGYWGPTNVVSGTIHDRNGNIIGQLDGKWDDQMCQVLDQSGSRLQVLWKMSPFPKGAPDCYGFTHYGITLNEITRDLKGALPPTDSRLRPDVRALENGDLDLAESEKLRVEQMQRDRRNDGEEREPRWFRQVGEEWEYVGGYWEARARGWKKDSIAPLW
ncbi:oxysterol binding protein [Crepidotus variabilis]|uniref:Oxysterol binding protein n=1 Tax=Crepidotus variabilis TaxID=179855 RepID=A0A9P6JVT4_9AGAR|nr:oxysterol binding protein [Crepidotus variabilis]